MNYYLYFLLLSYELAGQELLSLWLARQLLLFFLIYLTLFHLLIILIFHY